MQKKRNNNGTNETQSIYLYIGNMRSPVGTTISFSLCKTISSSIFIDHFFILSIKNWHEFNHAINYVFLIRKKWERQCRCCDAAISKTNEERQSAQREERGAEPSKGRSRSTDQAPSTVTRVCVCSVWTGTVSCGQVLLSLQQSWRPLPHTLAATEEIAIKA